MRLLGAILAGKARVGKTRAVNLFTGSDFESKDSPTPVTQANEWKDVDFKDTTFRFFNSPGLMTAQTSDMKANAEELAKAVKKCDEQVFIYMVDWVGGSVDHQDIYQFKQLKKVYSLEPKSVMFIVNKCPHPPRSEAEAALATYLQKLCFEEVKDNDSVPVVFMPNFDGMPDDTLAEQEKLVARTVITRMLFLHPKEHTATGKLELDPETAGAKAEQQTSKQALQKLTKQFEAREAKFMEDVTRHKEAIAAQQTSIDALNAHVQHRDAEVGSMGQRLGQITADLEEEKRKPKQEGGGGGGVLGGVLGLASNLCNKLGI